MHPLSTAIDQPAGARAAVPSSPGRLVLTGLLMTVVLVILIGVIYPFFLTGAAQVLFPDQANGSLIRVNGTVVGARLIGQQFTSARYFQGRPSAAGAGYDAANSGGTNLGPTNATLLKNTVARAAAIRKENGLPPDYVLPADAVSTSASGLDPDISPAYADLQVPRVARVRGLSQATVQALVTTYTSGRTLGILGEPRVNVLALNLALDRLQHRR